MTAAPRGDGEYGDAGVGYGEVMASPAAHEPNGAPVPPAADPEPIRACLPASLVPQFDREWEIVMDRAKRDRDLGPVHGMLGTWRHLASAEQRDPGCHDRLLAQAQRGLNTGRAPEGSVPGDDIKALIGHRLGRPA